MKTKIVAAVLALACLGAAKLPSERETWQRGTSAHFTYYTNAGEGRVRELAANLERLVDLLASRKGAKASPVPTAVYVFRDDKTFQPYKRNPDGSVRSLDGFFVRDDLSNYVALDASTLTPRIVLHEYLHQFNAYNFPPLPVWLNEGLAEYFSTFSTSAKGAQVGRPVQEHVLWLRQNKLIPLSRLFAVSHDDPEYNEQSKQGVFYAESWALVHFLLMADQGKHGHQLTDYIDRLDRGQSPQEALAVLGDLAALQKGLESYVRQSAFAFRNEVFEDEDLAAGVAFQPLSREDTLFRLGDLLLRTSELREDAAEHFRAALAVSPQHGGALGGLALIDAHAGRWEQAVAGFERAVAASPEDPELRLRLAQSLYQAEFEAGRRSAAEEMPPRVLLAREHAAKAAALRPDSFDGQFLLGLTYLFQDKDVEPGIAALERAHALAPGRADVLLALGGLQMLAERLDQAKASFREVVRSASEPDLVTQAKQDLAGVAVAEAFAELEKTHDLEKASAAIRAVLPDLEASHRAEVEMHLARLEAMLEGSAATGLEPLPAPPLESGDLDAHLQYGMQQANAADDREGKDGVLLATEAARHFRRGTEIDASSADAWTGLATSCIRGQCAPMEGERAAEKALTLKPGDPFATYLMANYWIDGEQYDRARKLVLPMLDVEGPMRDELRLVHVRAVLEASQALVEAGRPGEALKLLDGVPLPDGERGKKVQQWLTETRADAEQRYWGNRLIAAAEARNAGDPEKARKIFQDVLARCPDREIVKMARQELTQMGK
ncbi:MAG TPA: tetratricopeptide repeat protein [Candidatus Polarisedimenticolaceae bacterium]|nr:tetratricopeptide repeat protein [Candidatus Polarisedimenticolaceae bacterium]